MRHRASITWTTSADGHGRVPKKLLRGLVVTVLFAAGGMLIARLLGYRLGFNTIVRCRKGHIFTTTWFPGIKLKAIDLGIARLQRCPIGKHWTLITPVRESTLSDEDRRSAMEHHDVRIP
jgi:hypothetical protein